MRKAILAMILLMAAVLGACSSNNSSAPATEDEVKEMVQGFYNELSLFDQESKSSLEDFNTALADYSSGTVSAGDMEKALDEFQDTSSRLANEVKDVEVSKRLPDDIEKLLQDSVIAFQSAFSAKEQAAKGAASPEVTADEFNSMNQQADVAMLFGISKLNEARVAAGLIDADSTEAATLSSVQGTVATPSPSPEAEESPEATAKP